MCENNHKSLIIQHFRELLGHLALFYLVIWRYFTWSFGVILLGHLAFYLVIWRFTWSLTPDFVLYRGNSLKFIPFISSNSR